MSLTDHTVPYFTHLVDALDFVTIKTYSFCNTPEFSIVPRFNRALQLIGLIRMAQGVPPKSWSKRNPTPFCGRIDKLPKAS